MILQVASLIVGAHALFSSKEGPIDKLAAPIKYKTTPEQAPFFASTTKGAKGIKSDDFATYALPDLPGHTLRVRSKDSRLNDYCEGAGNGYTGYFSVERDTKHFYFAYFESRSKPLTDPMIMWINGGPGCSSTTGWLMELGSCRVNLDGNGTTKNDHSWTEAASVVFLDQP
jgi:carboxypeptidase C (cathepsin A)